MSVLDRLSIPSRRGWLLRTDRPAPDNGHLALLLLRRHGWKSMGSACWRGSSPSREREVKSVKKNRDSWPIRAVFLLDSNSIAAPRFSNGPRKGLSHTGCLPGCLLSCRDQGVFVELLQCSTAKECHLKPLRRLQNQNCTLSIPIRGNNGAVATQRRRVGGASSRK